MKTIQRPWDWWAYQYRVIHRTQIPGISQWDDNLVELIVEVLELKPGDRVLDLACGSGEHARRLASRGLNVVGTDIAPSLVEYCQEQASEQALYSVQFEVGDMRKLAYANEYDAVLLLSGSFGFFDDEVNKDVVARMVRALRPGGRVLIDVADPGQMTVRPPKRTWSRYGGGYSLTRTWWESEICTYVNEFMYIDSDGVLNTSAELECIRIYSLPEWREIFAEVGLRMIHALADTALPLVPYDRDHFGNLVIVGQKEGN